MAQGQKRCGKEYFEDIYNIDTQEQVVVHMCDFDGIRRGKYFRGESTARAEDEMRGGEVKNESPHVRMRLQKK